MMPVRAMHVPQDIRIREIIILEQDVHSVLAFTQHHLVHSMAPAVLRQASRPMAVSVRQVSVLP